MCLNKNMNVYLCKENIYTREKKRRNSVLERTFAWGCYARYMFVNGKLTSDIRFR